jgi:hypothetical protein
MDECKPLVDGEEPVAVGDEHRHPQGEAVQVDPMKPKLKPPGTTLETNV